MLRILSPGHLVTWSPCHWHRLPLRRLPVCYAFAQLQPRLRHLNLHTAWRHPHEPVAHALPASKQVGRARAAGKLEVACEQGANVRLVLGIGRA